MCVFSNRARRRRKKIASKYKSDFSRLYKILSRVLLTCKYRV